MLSTCVPSATMMLARCGLASTRSVLNRPSARILPSSSAICGWTLVNMFCLRFPTGGLRGVAPRLALPLPFCPVEYYLAAFACPNGVECGGIIGGVEPVRYDRADVDTRLRQD